MISEIIKLFLIKKKLKKASFSSLAPPSPAVVQHVGLLLNANSTFNKNKLLLELKHQGFDISNVKVMLYKEKLAKEEVIEEPFFSLKDIDTKGAFIKESVVHFTKQSFDLLINLFPEDDLVLHYVALNSQARFKVGLASSTTFYNHLIIDGERSDSKKIIEEIVKYLRILKKI